MKPTLIHIFAAAVLCLPIYFFGLLWCRAVRPLIENKPLEMAVVLLGWTFIMGLIMANIANPFVKFLESVKSFFEQ